MHIWTMTKWKKYYNPKDNNHRDGIRLRFDKNVNNEVKRACKEFCKWLRQEYYFPQRVPIYIKSAKTIKSADGELVSAIFFEPFDKTVEPYIRISTGDYTDLLDRHGKDDALALILSSIVHELTHYFQWINDLNLTPVGAERQAKNYVNFIIDEYSQTREHP